MTAQEVGRLDAFTDAAFAFAITLLVAGTSGTIDGAAVRRAVLAVPAFLIGFSIIAMFWFAHVRWRSFRGMGDYRSLLLTLALIFTILVYVIPLRGMAASFASYLGAGGDGFDGGVAELFRIYGGGFFVMCVITAGLYRDALRNLSLGSGPIDVRAAI